MSVSVVTPVWNGRDLLQRMLVTVSAQTEAPLEILAVDNGSTDGADDEARRGGARVISMGRNTGFAPAVNRGIRESRGEWVAVLNSDVELAPDYFEKLLAAARRENAWFATGKLLAGGAGCPTDRLDGTFDLLCRGGTAWRAGNGHADAPAFSAPSRINSAPWTAALFRSELFERVGMLEESFESYLEDVDFGIRCAMAGLQGVYVPEAVAWHHGSASLGRWHPRTVRSISRNQVFLLARHYPGSLLWRNAWRILVAHTLWGAVAARRGAALAWLIGKWEGISGFPEARRQRTSWPVDKFRELLCANERVIYDLQAANRFDAYWKMYFLLTGGGAK